VGAAFQPRIALTPAFQIAAGKPLPLLKIKRPLQSLLVLIARGRITLILDLESLDCSSREWFLKILDQIEILK
jgi:hypothetical protein